MQAILFELPLQQAITEVLESMCFLSIDEDSVPGAHESQLLVTRRLEFHGPFSGSFGMQVPFTTASLITCNLLGQESDEITPELVGESIGEIVNMVCGAVLCRLENKYKFDLSAPHNDHVKPTHALAPNNIRRSYLIEGERLEAWMEIEQTS